MSEESRLDRRERELRERAEEDLPALALTREVTDAMADFAESVSIDSTGADDQARAHALWFMLIIGVRATRAAMGSIASGYEDQAFGYQRLVDELHNRAQKVREDSSGDYARQWLEGRSLGKGAKMAGQEFWEFISGPVHANVRAVLDWLAVSQEDGSTKVIIGPERRPEVANATLTYLASEGRDLLSMLSLEIGRPLDLSALDERIRAAHDEFIPGTLNETDT